MFTTLFAASALAGFTAGQPAPDFTAKNQHGKTVRLSDFRGKPVLVYFYPKDDTPGCTKEACKFRDAFTEYKKLGAVILGVSRQDEASHQKFIAKHNIPYDLLVDHDGEVARLMGAEKMPLLGVHKRQSVLIDADGNFAKKYENVDPESHSDEVIQDIKSLLRK